MQSLFPDELKLFGIHDNFVWLTHDRNVAKARGQARAIGVKKIEICVSAPTVAWCGMAWHGVPWLGMVWHGVAWHGMAWHGGDG